MKKIFLHTVTKSIIFLILPLAYTSMFSLAISGIIAEERKNDLLVWSIIALLLHIIALTIYGVIDERHKKQLEHLERSIEKAPKELNNMGDLLHTFNKVILDNANKLYGMVQNKKGHSDIVNWDWMQSRGDDICDAIYNFIKKIAESGNNFSVSMMFKKVKNGVQGYTMMSRSSNNASHTPKAYRNFIPEAEVVNSYYKKIFDENPSRPKILLNKKEIEENFVDINGINYSQYIALPISCKGKIIGLIQIVAYDNSLVASTKSELLRLCDDYFAIAQSTILLSDKSENIQQIL